MRVVAILLACAFLAVCETAAEQQDNLHLRILEQMGVQDDTYCRLQRQQSYKACRQTRADSRRITAATERRWHLLAWPDGR
jgi:hypothetical protein